MKFGNQKKMVTALVLAFTLLMGNGTIVSASQMEAPVVDVLQEYVPEARSNTAPSQHTNLSNRPYQLEGVFTHQVFTNYSFSADGNGELEFGISVDYEDYDFEDLPLERQVAVTIEVWRDDLLTPDDIVYSRTFYAQQFLDTDGYEDAVYCSDVVSGLSEDVDTHYYILICKERDGMSATVDGTISHP